MLGAYLIGYRMGQRYTRTVAPATRRQLAFIETLAEERGADVDTDGLTVESASALIEKLKARERVGSEEAAPFRKPSRMMDP